MGLLHPSFPTILFDDNDQSCRLGSSMARWIYATWFISWRAAKLTGSPPPPAIPHRPVGHVKRDRPARAGSRGATVRRGVMPVALTEQGATLQAGAQRILGAVQARRDDVAAVSGQIRGTVTLGSTLHTGPPDLARVLANVRDRHPALSSNCTSPRTVQCAPAIGRRRVNGYRPIRQRRQTCHLSAAACSRSPPFAYVKLVNRWSSCADRIICLLDALANTVTALRPTCPAAAARRCAGELLEPDRPRCCTGQASRTRTHRPR